MNTCNYINIIRFQAISMLIHNLFVQKSDGGQTNSFYLF